MRRRGTVRLRPKGGAPLASGDMRATGDQASEHAEHWRAESPTHQEQQQGQEHEYVARAAAVEETNGPRDQGKRCPNGEPVINRFGSSVIAGSPPRFSAMRPWSQESNTSASGGWLPWRISPT